MKRAKNTDRQFPRHLGHGREMTVRLLEAIDVAAVFFYGTYRYRQVAISQGFDGLRRVMRDEDRREVIKRLRDLRRRGLIQERARHDRVELALTERGRGALLKSRVLSSACRPDARRLMVAFDIPETHHHARAAFRTLLRSAGFVRLQDSVWVSDRDAAGALSEWMAAEGISAWVRTFVVEEI